MLDLVIALLCFFMAYSNVKMLVEVPFAKWGLVQGLLVAVSIGLVAVGAMKGWAWWKNKQKQDQEKALEAKKIEEDREIQKKEGKKNDDLAYLDELDAMEDAQKLNDKEKPSLSNDSVKPDS